MHYVIPGVDVDPNIIRRVPLGEYCTFFIRTIRDHLSSQRKIPFLLGFDGWLAAIYTYTYAAFEKKDWKGDKILRVLFKKQISTLEIDLETFACPPASLKGIEERESFAKAVNRYWDLLCYSKGATLPTDHLEFTFKYFPSGTPNETRCQVNLRQPLPFPLTKTSDFDPLSPYFLYFPQIKYFLPKSGVFFSSRLTYLRHLSHQAQVFHNHGQKKKYEEVMSRVIQVVLQMLVYHRSMRGSKELEGELASIDDWIQLLERGDECEREMFGTWTFRRNLADEQERVRNKEEPLREIWMRAADWACSGTDIDRREVIEGLVEMQHWILKQFREIKLGQAQKRLEALHAARAHERSPTPTQSSYYAQNRRSIVSSAPPS